MNALVLHPRFSLYGGGELLALNVMEALQKEGFYTTLFSDEFSPAKCEKMFGMGSVMKNSEWFPLPAFRRTLPKFMAYQRLKYAKNMKSFFEKRNAKIIFSTQSTIYFLPKKKVIHFVYDMEDLSLIKPGFGLDFSFSKLPYYLLMRRYRELIEKPEPERFFFALSKGILSDLKENGYLNSNLIHPPCPLLFHPRQKQNRIIQVTRIVPQKRLEMFKETARKLPEYEFMIIGQRSPLHEDYWKEFLKGFPDNLVYEEVPIRSRPEVLEESKVYLYTSVEPGWPIAFTQGIGAGCFPVAPDLGGGFEVVNQIGVGKTYKWNSVDSAVESVKGAMKESNLNLREKVEPYSCEAFQKKVLSPI